MPDPILLLTLAAIFGLFMAWGIGANDVANAMATSTGSKALKIRHAIIIAGIFEFAGAFLAGGEVTDTVRKGMVDLEYLEGTPEILVYGMLASLLAAGSWLLMASWFGWPVSTTHSIIGAIVGFAAVGVSMEAVHWPRIGTIVLSWVVSPGLAGLVAFALFRSVQTLVFNHPDPFTAARRYVPVYIFLAAFVVALVTLLKGLSHVGLEVSMAGAYGYAALLGVVVGAGGMVAVRRIQPDPRAERGFHFANVERVFIVLMVVTASAMAFAHGSNDVANAIGPVAAVVSTVEAGTLVGAEAPVPNWVLLLGGVGIVAGLAMFGYRVMAKVGTGITELTPSRAFAATLAAAGTVVIASGAGLPISTTHTLVGAVIGVGIARGIAALNLRVIRTIVLSWVITLPAGALMSILFFYLLQGLLG